MSSNIKLCLSLVTFLFAKEITKMTLYLNFLTNLIWEKNGSHPRAPKPGGGRRAAAPLPFCLEEQRLKKKKVKIMVAMAKPKGSKNIALRLLVDKNKFLEWQDKVKLIRETTMSYARQKMRDHLRRYLKRTFYMH